MAIIHTKWTSGVLAVSSLKSLAYNPFFLEVMNWIKYQEYMTRMEHRSQNFWLNSKSEFVMYWKQWKWTAPNVFREYFFQVSKMIFNFFKSQFLNHKIF
jgi:hypothetical protein